MVLRATALRKTCAETPEMLDSSGRRADAAARTDAGFAHPRDWRCVRSVMALPDLGPHYPTHAPRGKACLCREHLSQLPLLSRHQQFRWQGGSRLPMLAETSRVTMRASYSRHEHIEGAAPGSSRALHAQCFEPCPGSLYRRASR
jgi:hypothetical protein